MPQANMNILLEVGVVEEGYADLIGVITGMFGRPVSNALVEIDSETYKSTITDDFGKYEFLGITPTSWNIHISHSLYEPYEGIVNAVEMEVNVVNINLSTKITIKIGVAITGFLGLFIGGMKLAGGKK